MILQEVSLPPDITYVLDGMRSEWMITDACHTVLQLFAPRRAVMDLIDEDPRDHPRPYRTRARQARRIERMALDLMFDAPEDLRDAYAAMGVMCIIKECRDLASIYAGWNFEDTLVGGCLENFRKRDRCGDDYQPFKKTRRKLYAPSAIRRYVKVHDREAEELTARASLFRSVRWPAAGPRCIHALTDLYTPQREAIRRRIAKEGERLRCMELFGANWKDPFEPPALKVDQRKMLARSANAAAAVVGQPAVSDFVQGRAVAIRGESLTFEVQKASTSYAVGHGALDIQIKDHDDRALAKLCFYVEKTPALDQLAAIALFVESGAEREVFETGNLYAVTATGYENPMIRERAPSAVGPGRQPDRKAVAIHEYVADTLGYYTEALSVQVWGRDAKRAQTFEDLAA